DFDAVSGIAVEAGGVGSVGGERVGAAAIPDGGESFDAIARRFAGEKRAESGSGVAGGGLLFPGGRSESGGGRLPERGGCVWNGFARTSGIGFSRFAGVSASGGGNPGRPNRGSGEAFAGIAGESGSGA